MKPYDFQDFSAETFQQKFCRRFDLPAEHYTEAVLTRTLYPHARWMAELGSQDAMAADLGFVAGVGRLKHWRGFAGEAQEFQCDPQNHLFSRRTLRLRVSVDRMRLLFSEVWSEPVPVPKPGSCLPCGSGLAHS